MTTTRRRRMVGRAAALTAGIVADRIFGDPVRHHPVAWFGTAADRLEKRMGVVQQMTSPLKRK